jgi:hypothetical protein
MITKDDSMLCHMMRSSMLSFVTSWQDESQGDMQLKLAAQHAIQTLDNMRQHRFRTLINFSQSRLTSACVSTQICGWWHVSFKSVATCDAMRWFCWDAMIFCNNFAR